MKYMLNSELEYAFVTMINKLIFGHQRVLRPLLISLRGIDSNSSMETIQEIDKKIAGIEEQRKVLMSLQTRGYLEPAVYTRGNYNVHACQDTKFNFLVMNSFREFYAAT